MGDAEKFSFLCEHYEEHSQMTKEFLLSVFVKRPGGPHEVSIFDTKHRRMFLKRGVFDQDGPIRLEDLYIGGSVVICARKFKVTAHADSATRELYAKASDQIYSVVSGPALSELGTILTEAAAQGLTLKRAKMFLDAPTRRRCAALELVGALPVEEWTKAVREAVGSATAAAVTAERPGPSAEKLFESRENTATCESCAVCVVRPHAVREGQAGAVISELVGSGFEISALLTFSLLRSQAETFCEVYKTVVPSAQYSAMIAELASGVCIVLEVRSKGDVVSELRELCGPYDVEIARHLRPNTIRARYGRDNVHNAVHCTDLPEDGPLESQYFFSILPAVC